MNCRLYRILLENFYFFFILTILNNNEKIECFLIFFLGLTGNNFGESTPKTNSETIYALIIMVSGGIFSAFVFSGFESYIDLARKTIPEKV